ncbi:mitochondrial proton/calcium exchanger protein-like protein isoform X1 [Tanacetum coccineum]
MSESAKIHEENSNLIKEIRASIDVAIRNQGASIKTLEIQIGQMSKVLQERGFESLPSLTEKNPRDQVKSISTSIYKLIQTRFASYWFLNQYDVSTGQNSTPLYKARQTTIPFPSRLDNHYCEEEGNYEPKFMEACGASHINNAIPQKKKDPESFTLPCFINDFCFDNALVDLGASVNRTVKYSKGIVENVLVGIGKFTYPVDFIILDMPEDIRVPLILRRPFLSTARAKIDVYKRKFTLRVREEILFSKVSFDHFLEDYIELNDLNEPFELRRNQGNDLIPTIEEGEVIEEFRTRHEDLDTGINDYPGYCDDDKKIHIDCAHNLKFCSLENMDAYRDEGMGDVIFGEPFLREADIKAKRFEGMITLYKGDD